jgi:8-oxo-dGTP diphosphatase
MAPRDGNGWTTCGLGHRHWGVHGAAGLLAYAPDPDGGPVRVLLQLRSAWSHRGGTWGLPGGARDSHESVTAAALREAAEECAIPGDAVKIYGLNRDDHESWTYWTVIGGAPKPFEVQPDQAEAEEAAWVPEPEVEALPLHPGFASQWPVLRQALAPLTIVVDVANVMGSRPDGWWRDRAGAAARLRDQLAGLPGEGVTGLPESLAAPALNRWFPDLVLIVEGAARPVASQEPPAEADGRLRVVAAAGSGDDTITEVAAGLPGRRLVITADRELRQRVAQAGAAATGPGWLLDQTRGGRLG